MAMDNKIFEKCFMARIYSFFFFFFHFTRWWRRYLFSQASQIATTYFFLSLCQLLFHNLSGVHRTTYGLNLGIQKKKKDSHFLLISITEQKKSIKKSTVGHSSSAQFYSSLYYFFFLLINSTSQYVVEYKTFKACLEGRQVSLHKRPSSLHSSFVSHSGSDSSRSGGCS